MRHANQSEPRRYGHRWEKSRGLPPCDAAATKTNFCNTLKRCSMTMKTIECAASNSRPKLGDFRKLYRDDPISCSSQQGHIDASTDNTNRKCLDLQIKASKPGSGTDVKLGDFEKVRWELWQHSSKPHPNVLLSRTESLPTPQTLVTGETYDKELPPSQPRGTSLVHFEATESSVRSSLPISRLPTPPLSDCADLSYGSRKAPFKQVDYTPNQSSESEWDSIDLLCDDLFQTKANTEILSYKVADRGRIVSILGKKLSLDQKHEALSVRLLPLRAGDVSIEAYNHSVALNGIHIFLDMSNINISFQHALRQKYSLKEHSRFLPLPQLNLQFLTEILVRNRRTMTLNAGCSVLPDRHEPRFIQELRKLGYRVDLRERRLIAEARGPINYTMSNKGRGGGAPDRMAALHTVARFMEDLVDETLQTRIAESVMEYFENPGTLVLATGDAQPAKYSDGFFTYAERALRMGWHVEVVSWNLSLSSRWRKSGLTEKWGNRFRLIRLDDFLDELLM
ncbi:hypothetical protein E4U43_000277 [Claviceps pusilla]|uniref:NYN domain-containing protein n=1 Tax=Claviceps pusilla TaxID=123648 RepID=A0A9P7SZ79_9HYPO|nr:hypothetical protein E4U43_000277 [Claviceps pusilla]